MKSNLLQLGFVLIALCLFAALEEMLPKFFGVGLPLLLAISVYNANRRSVAMAMAVAVAAGAIEDAISMLPFMSSVGFFLFVAIACRWWRLPISVLPMEYAVFQMWLVAWSGMSSGVWMRILVSILLGILAWVTVFPLMDWLERSAAINEES